MARPKMMVTLASCAKKGATMRLRCVARSVWMIWEEQPQNFGAFQLLLCSSCFFALSFECAPKVAVLIHDPHPRYTHGVHRLVGLLLLRGRSMGAQRVGPRGGRGIGRERDSER